MTRAGTSTLDRRDVLKSGILAGAASLGGCLRAATGENAEDGTTTSTTEGDSGEAPPFPMYNVDPAKTGRYPGTLGVDSAPELRWENGIDSVISEPPVIAGETVVVMDDELQVSAYALSDGERRWHYDLSSPEYADDRPSVSPSISGGNVYYRDGSGITVRALDSGEQTHRFESEREVIFTDIVPTDEGVYAVGSTESRSTYVLFKFTARDSTPGISASVDTDTPPSIPRSFAALGDDHVFVTAGQKVAAVGLDTGQVEWEHTWTAQSVTFAPVYRDGAVYLPFSSWRDGGKLLELDAASGEVTSEGSIASVSGSPVIDSNGSMYCPMNDGLVRLDDSLSEDWFMRLRAAGGTPLVGDSTVVMTQSAEDGGIIHGISKAGNESWTLEHSNPAIGPVSAVRGSVVVPSYDTETDSDGQNIAVDQKLSCYGTA